MAAIFSVVCDVVKRFRVSFLLYPIDEATAITIIYREPVFNQKRQNPWFPTIFLAIERNMVSYRKSQFIRYMNCPSCTITFFEREIQRILTFIQMEQYGLYLIDAQDLLKQSDSISEPKDRKNTNKVINWLAESGALGETDTKHRYVLDWSEALTK